MYLMMEKQHNRGQDGAGFASIKLDVAPGERYISRQRSIAQQPIQDIFEKINGRINEVMVDALGYRRKFAVVAPSTNTIVQPEFDAMAPHGVTNHFSRSNGLKNFSSTSSRLLTPW